MELYLNLTFFDAHDTIEVPVLCDVPCSILTYSRC